MVAEEGLLRVAPLFFFGMLIPHLVLSVSRTPRARAVISTSAGYRFRTPERFALFLAVRYCFVKTHLVHLYLYEMRDFVYLRFTSAQQQGQTDAQTHSGIR